MAQPAPAAVPDRDFTVGDLLRTQPFAQARVVAVADGAAARPAEWISVLEWPIEDFVQRGEVVLTTGAGCWPRRLAELLVQIVDADAACVCIAFDPAGEVQEVPPRAVEAARRRGVPLVVLPWKVRFSEVIRAFVDGLLRQRYGTADGGIAGAFTRALLGESGLAAVAGELERMLGRGVLVLDARLEPAAAGPRLQRTIDLDALGARLRALAPAERAAAARALDSPEPVEIAELPLLGPGAVTAIAARARHRSLGYVLVLDGQDVALPALGRDALVHAATAVAIEMLRAATARRAALSVRGDALWSLARGELHDADDLAATATRLGLGLRAEYAVAAGEAGGEDAEERARAAPALAEAIEGAEPAAVVAASGAELLVLLPAAAGGQERLLDVLRATPGADWGIAERALTIADLAAGRQAAYRALAVGRALHGPGSVGDGRALGPFLLLHGLSRDEEALRTAREILDPLVRYDAQTSRDFLHTLEVFLAENGNGTAAARRLYLNRHSLAYRLRKIEELTGRSLSDHDDRFLLELSLRMLRL